MGLFLLDRQQQYDTSLPPSIPFEARSAAACEVLDDTALFYDQYADWFVYGLPQHMLNSLRERIDRCTDLVVALGAPCLVSEIELWLDILS